MCVLSHSGLLFPFRFDSATRTQTICHCLNLKHATFLFIPLLYSCLPLYLLSSSLLLSLSKSHINSLFFFLLFYPVCPVSPLLFISLLLLLCIFCLYHFAFPLSLSTVLYHFTFPWSLSPLIYKLAFPLSFSALLYHFAFHRSLSPLSFWIFSVLSPPLLHCFHGPNKADMGLGNISVVPLVGVYVLGDLESFSCFLTCDYAVGISRLGGFR